MIKTDRLILKNIELNDKNDMLDMFLNKEVKKTYMIPDYDDIEKYTKLFNKFVELSNDSNRFVRGIYLENKLIGFLNDVEINNFTIELGYVISPKYKNNGYMTEALKAAISYLLKNGYKEVICGAFYFNNPSIRVMEKCGMQRLEKTDYVTYKNKEILCVYYSKK